MKEQPQMVLWTLCKTPVTETFRQGGTPLQGPLAKQKIPGHGVLRDYDDYWDIYDEDADNKADDDEVDKIIKDWLVAGLTNGARNP